MADVLSQFLSVLQKTNEEGKEQQLDSQAARALENEDMQQALVQLSLQQLDAFLDQCETQISVERSPRVSLGLLNFQAAKLERYLKRKRPSTIGKQHDLEAVLLMTKLVHQISQFLYQLPTSAAIIELPRLSVLCNQYLIWVVELNQSIKAVYPLKTLLKRLYAHGCNGITSIHGKFFFACLHSKCYFAAIDVLEQPSVLMESDLVQSVDFLYYGYYGGMIFLGQKRFEEAANFLLMTITAPATALSAVVVESYKKYLLLHLLCHAPSSMQLPKYTSLAVNRNVENHCLPYIELVKAFENRDVQSCIDIIQNFAQDFNKDGNFGLVKQVYEVLKEKKIIQLTRTYVTISLNELALRSAFDSEVDAEKMLLSLVCTHKVKSAIDIKPEVQPDLLRGKMVTFFEDDEEFNSNEVLEKIHSEMIKIMKLSDQMRRVDKEIVSSVKFVSKARERERRRTQSEIDQTSGKKSSDLDGGVPFADDGDDVMNE